MKTNSNIVFICLLTISNLLFVSNSFSQLTWYSQSGPVTYGQMNGVDFLDENTGWIVERTLTTPGNVLKTTDGGLTWTPNYIPSAFWLKSVSFVNASTGWVLDYDGQIFKTSDGGINWTNQYTNLTDPWLYEIFFINDQKGWVSTAFDILYTTNGGVNWDTIISPVSGSAMDIEFYNENIGYVVGLSSAFNFAKSTDGGLNWTVYSAPYTGILEISIVDENKVWVVAENGAIGYTNDGGETWTQKGIGLTTENLISIDFYDELNGVIGGANGLILTTADGGETWVINNLPTGVPDVAFLAVKMVNSSNAWIVGNDNGIILTSKAENDVVFENYLGDDIVCEGESIEIIYEVKNHGTSPINLFTLYLFGNDGLLLEFEWGGILNSGETTTINLGEIFLYENQVIYCTIEGDYVTTNNYWEQEFTVIKPENISVNGPHTVCPNENVILEVTGGLDYEWSFTDENNAEVSILSGVQDEVFTVNITYDENYNCEYTDSIFVYINSSCEENITAFTPNGDGVNDYLYIKEVENIPINKVYIFNRWGDLVISFENYDNTSIVWSGEDDFENNVANNTYFYVIESEMITNSTTKLSGWFQVLY